MLNDEIKKYQFFFQSKKEIAIKKWGSNLIGKKKPKGGWNHKKIQFKKLCQIEQIAIKNED
jgi:hypothetical protein